MKCPRCNNQNPKYFYTYKNITYCRKCISIGRLENSLTLPSASKTVDYKLDYRLTALQQSLSDELLQRYQNHLNTTLKAVCGAGKTEITYAVIKYALNHHQKVCFTTPRKELVIELTKRLQSQFINADIISVYGQHCKELESSFIVCTTHQLYRYYKAFDLLILDEIDAFPYYNNDTLQGILKNSIKGNYIYMSATLNTSNDLLMTKRYHGHLLDIPKCYLTSPLLMYLLVIIKLKKYIKVAKPVLLFVATTTQTKKIAKILKYFNIKSQAVSSKSTNVHDDIDKLINHQLDVLVTTTILERGITIENVQVIVMFANNYVFNTSTLIQICGRVGRKINHPHGEISFFTPYLTKEIRQCLKTIKQDNV